MKIERTPKEIIEFIEKLKQEGRDGSEFVTFDDLSEIFDFTEKSAPLKTECTNS